MLPCFLITLFVSAFLLFLVQPMVGKMILPSLGGTPAVWNTCMVFFQAALLAGYAYAHGSVAWLGIRRQAAFHIALLLLPLVLSLTAIAVVLPIAIDTTSVPSTQDNPVFWLLLRLTLGVGLPFFVVSSNAPLLQMWFSRTRHTAAKDPYFLYAASNLGSLLALLGYPLIVEPYLGLDDQSWLWAGGYTLLIVMALGCAIAMWRSSAALQSCSTGEVNAATAPPASDEDGAAEGLTAGRRLRWIALALVPSSLMLGVTTHVTTDIAPVPLLWVVPLALYLLSFVFVFARRHLIPRSVMVKVFQLAIALTAITTVQGEVGLGLLPVPLHLVTFFLAAMVCHGELARDRPSTKHLTQFYLLMSVGGVLGGLLNAVVAPIAFDTIAEYPIMMVIACLVIASRSQTARPLSARLLDYGGPVLAGLAVAGFLLLIRNSSAWPGGSWPNRPLDLTIGFPVVLCLLLSKRPFRFGLAVAAVLFAITLCMAGLSEKPLYVGRNFYGVKKVVTEKAPPTNSFLHGSTVHGIQLTDPRWRNVPLAYFHPTGPVGDVFKMYNNRSRQGPVAIIGLGAGSMAAYAKPGQRFTFYEIDPEVARIARDTRFFTFMDDCLGECDVILGDGRLTLADAPDGHYGLVVIDAFSSDAIPTHLLTREALQLYVSKLDERGILVFHVSNRYLDLGSLLANLAQDAGWECLRRIDEIDTEEERSLGKYESIFVVMSADMRHLRSLQYDPEWKDIPARPEIGVWTDQFTNIFRLFGTP